MCEVLAARGAQYHPMGPVAIVVCGRLRRASVGLSALFARFRAGKLRVASATPRRARSRPESWQPSASREPSAPAPVSLPRRFGWLVRMIPTDFGYGVEVASFRARICAYRSQLRHLLADPEMVALIEASPRQAARLLRPLCTMLGIDPIPALERKLPADPSPPAPEADRTAPSAAAASGALSCDSPEAVSAITCRSDGSGGNPIGPVLIPG
jgi:hypothetical protein